MNRFFWAAILSLLTFASAAHADGPDDQYVQAYRFIQQGDDLKAGGNARGALERYYAAEEELRKIQRMAPDWQAALVRYRLNSVVALIAPLAKQFPDVQPPSGQPAPVAPAVTPKPGTKAGPATAAPGTAATAAAAISATGFERQLKQKNEELIALRTEKASMEAEYQARLKEALAAQTSGADPREVIKLEDRVKSLQKELDLQKLSFEKATKTTAQQLQSVDTLTKERAALEKRVQELTDKNENKTLRAENESLKQQTAELNRQMGNLPKLEEMRRELSLLKAELKAQTTLNETLARDNKKMELLLTDLPDLKPGQR
ncbi:hypothetical protein LBMAG56_54460 [Verrucomicrobiota bacterium]|nr:hypothetical protein LBMAG56_54460 [Verrucomicrobiota bacterium]